MNIFRINSEKVALPVSKLVEGTRSEGVEVSLGFEFFTGKL